MEEIKGNNIRIAFVYNLSIKEPLGIGYLSAYLKKCFPNIDIEFFDPRIDTINNIKDFCPNFVLYSLMSGQYKENYERNLKLKKELKPFISVFGGPHPTYFPEMINNDGVDIICRGEGEKPLKNLVDATLHCNNICFIKGLWIKYKDSIYKNDVDDLVEDLDDLPFPDRDLFYRKSPLFRSNIMKSVFTARGCPFKCSYCHNSSLNSLFKGKGNVLRCRSPKSVVDEIVNIKSKYNVRFISFGDDVFAGMRLEWLKEFDERYSKLKIPYNISIRAEFVTKEIAKYLKKSGCVSTAMAIEHGNYEYRKKYMFRNMTNELLINATKVLESEGIRVATPTMIGLPFTDIKDDLMTLKLTCKANPTYAGTTIFQPYPGLPLTEICLKHKLIEDTYVSKLHEDCYSPAYIKNINYKKVMKLRNSFGVLRLMNKWFNIDVNECYERLPDITLIKLLNIGINFLYFNKIYDYKRGIIGRIRELYIALVTGAYGYRITKKKISW